MKGTLGVSQKSLQQDETLEESLEAKVAEFANRMTQCGARNLHSLLIRAVEKSLITKILIEMKWNQVQAAHVLGLNRNTLRTKIRDLRIHRPKVEEKTP
tara:strand:+ start:284 stop:580 length:297 start_codon:yes stop_codon:yes gene_type:complete